MLLARSLPAVLVAWASATSAADARQPQVADALRATGIPVEKIETQHDAVVITLRYRDASRRQAPNLDAHVRAALAETARATPEVPTLIVTTYFEDIPVSSLAVPTADVIASMEGGRNGRGMLARASMKIHVDVDNALRPVVARQDRTRGSPETVYWLAGLGSAATLVLGAALLIWRRGRSRAAGPRTTPTQEPAAPGFAAGPTAEPPAFCANCGDSVEPDSRFCGSCGAALD
jgi:hypothetical protein